MRHIFAQAVASSVVDSDDHHGRNRAFSNEPVGSLVGAPLNACKGKRSFKQILRVVQIKHRIRLACVFRIVVSWGQPYAKETVVMEGSAVKFMEGQIAGH